jgi:hypothetical protein
MLNLSSCRKNPAKKKSFSFVLYPFPIVFASLLCSITQAQNLAAAKNSETVSYLNAKFPYKISDVIVDKNNVTVRGEVPATSKNLFLCELPMFDETKMNGNSFASITPINATQSTFQLQLNRFAKFNDTGYDRIYSRWVIAAKRGNDYRLQSFANYARDIIAAANQYLPEERPVNKKGLEGFFTGENNRQDLLDLGVKNVTVNIVLTNWISLAPSQYSFRLNGQTYYFDPKVVEKYDNAFKFCADNNIFVTAVILIPRVAPNNAKSILVYPGSTAGAQSMANLTSVTSFNYYVAAVAFVAERYNKPNSKFARVQNWIVHNEADNGYYYANAGDAQMQYYTELYDRSMRTVYYTIRQYNPAAKVFLSLTHAWASTDNAKFFAPKDMLNVFNQLSKEQGDYEWGIAYHAYPQDAFNPKTWEDKKATNDINNTKYISPRNCELIDQWLRSTPHLYKGSKVRTLLFSEEGVHTKSDNPQDLLTQAAGVAYMWKKFTRLPTAEAFDYHAQADNRNEKGLRFGLWTAKVGTIATPDKKKPSWSVYKKAGTPSEDSAFAFALPIIGISEWSQAFLPLNDNNMPRTVTFNVTSQGQGTAVSDASVYFNGEMHRTINGKAIFYNVASLSNSRNYRVEKNGKSIAPEQSVVITKDQVINVHISQ